MNTKQTSYSKIGLVVVLAIVFVGVMANSVMTILRPSSPPPPPIRHAAKLQHQPATPQPTAPRPAASASATIAMAQAPSEAPKDHSSKPVWPKFALDEIIAYDPFAVAKLVDPVASLKSAGAASGDAKSAASAATDDSKAASPESGPTLTSRVHTVYQRGGKTAALVGSKTIRPGDQLEGAGRVVEVDQGGLMLEVKK
jgi:hypothetical protein